MPPRRVGGTPDLMGALVQHSDHLVHIHPDVFIATDQTFNFSQLGHVFADMCQLGRYNSTDDLDDAYIYGSLQWSTGLFYMLTPDRNRMLAGLLFLTLRRGNTISVRLLCSNAKKGRLLLEHFVTYASEKALNTIYIEPVNDAVKDVYMKWGFQEPAPDSPMIGYLQMQVPTPSAYGGMRRAPNEKKALIRNKRKY
jgi:hypothetical protein